MSTITKRRVPSIEAKWLAEAMTRRDLKPDDVDQLLGWHKNKFRQDRANGFPSEPARAQLEILLDVALWSTPRRFALRKKCLALFGYNPGTLNLPALRAKIARLQTASRIGSRASWAEVEECLLSAIAPLQSTPTQAHT